MLIPRIDLTVPEGDDVPSPFKRRQLPVLPALAMTINKAQGQTLDRVGVYLPRSVLAHGQLYVALSRCGNPANVRVLSYEHACNHVENVVYREVLE